MISISRVRPTGMGDAASGYRNNRAMPIRASTVILKVKMRQGGTICSHRLRIRDPNIAPQVIEASKEGEPICLSLHRRMKFKDKTITMKISPIPSRTT
jgi:hypothetical protein